MESKYDCKGDETIAFLFLDEGGNTKADVQGTVNTKAKTTLDILILCFVLHRYSCTRRMNNKEVQDGLIWIAPLTHLRIPRRQNGDILCYVY